MNSSTEPPVPTDISFANRQHSSQIEMREEFAALIRALLQHTGRSVIANCLTHSEVSRVARAKRAMSITGDKRSHFYDRQNPKHPSHDATFPRSFKLGDSPRSPTVWWEHELHAWLEQRAELSRKPFLGAS